MGDAYGYFHKDTTQGTSPKDIDTYETQTTWHRSVDDMRPMNTPDLNRHTYSLADNSAISMGGPADQTKGHTPQFSDANHIGADEYKYR
jgi:hypothetical protein